MKKDNQAFVDGQNSYMSTTAPNKPWQIDLGAKPMRKNIQKENVMGRILLGLVGRFGL